MTKPKIQDLKASFAKLRPITPGGWEAKWFEGLSGESIVSPEMTMNAWQFCCHVRHLADDIIPPLGIFPWKRPTEKPGDRIERCVLMTRRERDTCVGKEVVYPVTTATWYPLADAWSYSINIYQFGSEEVVAWFSIHDLPKPEWIEESP